MDYSKAPCGGCGVVGGCECGSATVMFRAAPELYDEEWFVIRCEDCGETSAFDVAFIDDRGEMSAVKWAIREVAKTHDCPNA